jgi:hypothetical protein
LIYQRLQGKQVCLRHGLGCLAVEAPLKDRQTLEGSLFGRPEQAPGLFEHGAHVAVSFRYIAKRGCQEIQVVLDFLGDLGACQGFQPGRRQL